MAPIPNVNLKGLPLVKFLTKDISAMEKTADLETKYQKLATEYSKIRSHATVLKKAVLDEQAKILELKEALKEQEQKIRKHDQEMDSLTFRNEQLTKRIAVLQQELQVNSHGKKSKNKSSENLVQSNFSVLDEELHKKILENAQLVSTMADKDLEISNNQERMQWLEDKLDKSQREIADLKETHKQELYEIRASSSSEISPNKTKECDNCKRKNNLQKELVAFKQEAEKWRAECELLRSKPDSNEQLTEFYENQLRSALEKKQIGLAEASSLWAENEALNTRLEHLTLEKNALERIIEKSNEELHTTNENYKSQLDAMTEHLAAQNEKITKQCDEIQLLKHKLSMKK